MENKIIKISLIPGNLLIAMFLVLFVMKLAGVGMPATWSWWIITMPLWFMPALVAGVCVGVALIALIGFLFYKISCLFD